MRSEKTDERRKCAQIWRTIFDGGKCGLCTIAAAPEGAKVALALKGDLDFLSGALGRMSHRRCETAKR